MQVIFLLCCLVFFLYEFRFHYYRFLFFNHTVIMLMLFLKFYQWLFRLMRWRIPLLQELNTLFTRTINDTWEVLDSLLPVFINQRSSTMYLIHNFVLFRSYLRWQEFINVHVQWIIKLRFIWIIYSLLLLLNCIKRLLVILTIKIRKLELI